MTIRPRLATFAFSLLIINACAAQKPVLSPNAHLASVGSPVAARDVDECIARAKTGAEAGPNKETPADSPIAGAAGVLVPAHLDFRERFLWLRYY
jgi:hypothetical protein